MGVISCERAKTSGAARGMRTSVGWPAQRFTQLQLRWSFVFLTLAGPGLRHTVAVRGKG